MSGAQASLSESRLIAASAARTASWSSDPIVADRHRGIEAVIDCTAVAATPSVVFTIEGYDAASGKWITLLTSAAIVGTGTTRLRVYPGIAVTANVAVNDCISKIVRITATHADSDSITYSVGATLLV